MLLVFNSKAAAKVMMFSAHALPILQAAGRPYTDELPPRGVIPHDQLATAIRRIEKVMSMDNEPEHSEDTPEHDDEPPVPAMKQPVSFRQRAYPLLDLMRKSANAEADVVWEPADTAW
ncbi:DUF1840 domain-containing protein [Paenalcaligenes niemegkensis]|uniref:DUF1840 domain-containing protein n=1 Tax=Paenalcaligenes niemegkensis TaxID=2895469 RepID=UPI001EE99F62|nr:DUF1840 domain-containing protein [Paenalcaligenes niemegkensis]MCQ9618023.1 DUF1840 domain-containing protein [Paenalcaligenes niemegkensis]